MVLVLPGLLFGCVEDKPWVPDVIVNVEDQPDHCQVRGAAVPCSSVAIYLRDTLKMPLNAPIQVSCVPVTSATCDQDQAQDRLMKAGYSNVIGYIDIASSKH